MVPVSVRFEHFRDPKASETCLSVPSNQDFILDALSISVRVELSFCFTDRTDATM